MDDLSVRLETDIGIVCRRLVLVGSATDLLSEIPSDLVILSLLALDDARLSERSRLHRGEGLWALSQDPTLLAELIGILGLCSHCTARITHLVGCGVHLMILRDADREMRGTHVESCFVHSRLADRVSRLRRKLLCIVGKSVSV